MDNNHAFIPLHPRGEDSETTLSIIFEAALSEANAASGDLQVRTPGGKVFVEWDARPR